MKSIVFGLLFFAFSFSEESPYIVVLGITQDGGLPHAGCIKKCC